MSKNPFDVIASFVDPDASYEDNCLRMATLLEKCEIPMEAVCAVLVSGVGMPAMYAQLVQAQAELKDCQHELEECQGALAAYQRESEELSDLRLYSRNG